MADRQMHVTKLRQHIYLVDVETGGLQNFIASYILKGSRVAIVETGPTSSIPSLLSALKQLDVRLEDVAYVAISHIHLDHGGGAGTLIKNLPNAKIVVHKRGAPHLIDPEKLWHQSKQLLKSITTLYGPPEPVPAERIIPATDNMTLDVGNGVKLKVIETLGHASHHQSYYETLSQGIFPGDAAGIYLKEFDAVVPTTPAPFILDSTLTSLDRLISQKPEALYYSHFGEASNPVERLQAYEEQLRLWTRIAREGVEKNQSLETVRERIIENDENMRRTAKTLKLHPVLGETVLVNSVQGIIEFAEKHASLTE